MALALGDHVGWPPHARATARVRPRAGCAGPARGRGARASSLQPRAPRSRQPPPIPSVCSLPSHAPHLAPSARCCRAPASVRRLGPGPASLRAAGSHAWRTGKSLQVAVPEEAPAAAPEGGDVDISKLDSGNAVQNMKSFWTSILRADEPAKARPRMCRAAPAASPRQDMLPHARRRPRPQRQRRNASAQRVAAHCADASTACVSSLRLW